MLFLTTPFAFPVIDQIGDAATLQGSLVDGSDEFCFLIKKLPDKMQVSVEGKSKLQQNVDTLFTEIRQLFTASE